MKLKKLYIKDYKILKNFTIEFPEEHSKNISVFIGINGSGKSTILEALAEILSTIAQDEKAKFGFELEYYLRFEEVLEETSTTGESHTEYVLVRLSANKRGDSIALKLYDPLRRLAVTGSFSGAMKVHFPLRNRASDNYSVLPENLVIYYSGLSEIMREISRPHIERQSRQYRGEQEEEGLDVFYFEPEHFGIVLISMLSFEFGDIPEFLREKGKIAGVQSVQIRLKKPTWAKAPATQFWGAEGEVGNFLQYLDENSSTAEDLQKPSRKKGTGNIVIETWQDESISITIITQQKLFEIRDYLQEERKLFEMLNIMLADGLLADISFSFYARDSPHLSFGILSEGEQQAIVIKGLTEFLSNKNTLFLFDEPDTYLHPKWQRQFITDIENTFETAYDAENSFLIATHSPQLLSNAKPERTFVKIIEDGQPVENTPKHYGREIGMILYELMGVEERTRTVAIEISNLFRLIEEEELEEAEELLNELRLKIGSDDPALKRAKLEIDYLKEG